MLACDILMATKWANFNIFYWTFTMTIVLIISCKLYVTSENPQNLREISY